MNKIELKSADMSALYNEVIYPEFQNAAIIDVYVQMLECLNKNIKFTVSDKNLNIMLEHELNSIIKGLKAVEDKMFQNMSVALVSLGSQDFITEIQNKKFIGGN